MLPFTAQCKYNELYSGHIITNGKKISFSLSFSIAQNQTIHGVSLTAKGTKDETKCRIKGKFNPKTGGLFFYETVVLSSKATFKNLNFCLLTGNLKRQVGKKEIKYSGTFTGFVRGSKKKCATGSLSVKSLKKKIPEKTIPQKVTPTRIVKTDTLFSNAQSKKSIRYAYKKDNIPFEIWDDANVDGDRISIYLDGKPILVNYTLQKTKKKLNLSLKDKKNHFLKIVALNEGKAAPNTSRIRLNTGSRTKEIRAHVLKKEFVYIQLKKE